MARYSTYWKFIPTRMVREYKKLKKDPSEQAQRFKTAIEQAKHETEFLPDGKLRLRAVKMVYIEKTHTIEGAARRLYVSRSTLAKWLGEFVNLVAQYSGFM